MDNLQIAQSVYVISKEAKRLRDERNELLNYCFPSGQNVYAYCIYSGEGITYGDYLGYWDSEPCCLSDYWKHASEIMNILSSENITEDVAWANHCDVHGYDYELVNVADTLENKTLTVYGECDNWTEVGWDLAHDQLDASVDKIKETHVRVRELRTEIDYLYTLKDDALFRLPTNKIGVHYAVGIGDMVLLECCGLQFHSRCEYDNGAADWNGCKYELRMLGKLDCISANVNAQKCGGISVDDAKEILRKYIHSVDSVSA